MSEVGKTQLTFFEALGHMTEKLDAIEGARQSVFTVTELPISDEQRLKIRRMQQILCHAAMAVIEQALGHLDKGQ